MCPQDLTLQSSQAHNGLNWTLTLQKKV